MTRIAFLEVDTEDIAKVQQVFPEAYIAHVPVNEEQTLASCKDAEVISSFIYSKFTKEILHQLPNLRLLCTRSVGFDHIDLDTCASMGITVCNVPDYGSHVIAEHVFALLLSTIRHISSADERTMQGTFTYHGLRGMSLRGKTMCIIGTGKIGSRVAEIAHGFGMKIVAVDQCRNALLESQYGVTYYSFTDAIPKADVISLHLPALPETYHIFNAQVFSQCKAGVIIVNTARGTLINAEDLVVALNSGQVAYALLDVLENEKNVVQTSSLTQHPHVIVTPHIAFYADDSMNHMYQECFTSIHTWQTGEVPLHIVKKIPAVCDLPPVQVKK